MGSLKELKDLLHKKYYNLVTQMLGLSLQRVGILITKPYNIEIQLSSIAQSTG